MSDTERAAEAEAIRSKLIALEEYRKLLNGRELTSNWLVVDQSMIDTFAAATRDRQFIHVDPTRAKAETPFGGTIAHGFLTLSLLSTLAFDAMPGVEGTRMGVNYGFERVRFLSPVKSGTRVRGRFRLIGLTERAVSLQSAWETVVEAEGAAKPALEHVVFPRNRDSQRGGFLIQTPCWVLEGSMDDATLFGGHSRTRSCTG